MVSDPILHDLNLGNVSVKKERVGFSITVNYYCGLPSETVLVRSAFRVHDEAKLLAKEAQNKALDEILA